MNGWYKQNRNVFERPWAKDAKMIAVYAYLHCVAYVNDGMLHGQVIRRGSCPTSNTAIMEATGLTEQEVRTRLKKLLEYGEIIVKPTNYGKIVTVCDYDSCGVSNDLFELNLTTEQPTQEQPSTTPTTTPSNTPYIKEDRIIYNNLRSRYTPSKKRESNKELALEIKAIYNKVFDGVLRKWERLSADMIIKVDNCVNRFGRQSVDMVFDQVKHEKFSLGDNNTGFIADFAFIFKLANYEAYLGRYELRLKQGVKKSVPTPEPKPQQQPTKMADTIDKYEAKSRLPTSAERKQNLLDMIEYIQSNPRSMGCVQLEEAYKSGELAAYGIDWKPNNI